MKTAVLILTVAVCGCSSGRGVDGLAASVDRGGPRVVFDLTAQPLAQIPFPNDVATSADSTSPTGLRLNVTAVAPTQLESTFRAQLDRLDGFGTFAPITVSFDRDIDVADLFARQNNADPTDDAVYLVDLENGATVPVDFGSGRFPLTIADPTRYFPADPQANAFNLLFPVQGAFANFFNPALPHTTVRQQADDLVTFYEFATHTLIIRPVLPLAEDSRYAVVLTSRLHDAQGRPISSPHAGINHASQTRELTPLLGHLPAGTQLSDIAYTWAFTTQSISRTFRILRQGLVETAGPFLQLGPIYSTTSGNIASASTSRVGVSQEKGPFVGNTNTSIDPADYILPVNECAAPPAPAECFKALLDDPDVGAVFSGTDAASIPALEASLQYVNYLVQGLFFSPDLLATTAGAPRDQTFQLDEPATTVRNKVAVVPFLLAVPKQVPAAGHLEPFPTVVAGHGFTSSRSAAVVGFAGSFAKFGLATVGIDAYGYGVAVDPALEVLARARADAAGLSGFASAFFNGRARDLDFDGVPDPGGDFFTADFFHTRDTIRQSVLDWMQVMQVLRSFNGEVRMLVGNKGNVVAGDFDGDGVPDVGGARAFPATVFAPNGTTHLFEKGAVNPGADIFTFGVSLGGILSAIVPAVEPEVRATAPVSAAGGLSDLALRSSLDPIIGGVYLEALGPFVATCAFSPSSGPVDARTTLHQGACNPAAADAVPSLVLVVQDVNRERDVRITPLTAPLAPGDRVMVQNVTELASDCSAQAAPGCSLAAADASGTVRVPIAADGPQLLGTETPQPPGTPATVSVSVVTPGDTLRVTILRANGTSAAFGTFAEAFTFEGIPYAAGSPLLALSRGFGRSRNTPELRRLLQLAQTILEPADPINYVTHYTTDLLAPRVSATAANGFRAGALNALFVTPAGDTQVPASTGIALARAAGLVDFSQPDPAYASPGNPGFSDDQVLIRGGVVEGIAATDRFDDPAGGVFAALPGHVQCDTSGGSCTGDLLLDPTGYACDGAATCTDGLAAPRLVPPLRQQLVRQIIPASSCPVSARAGATGCWSIGASTCAANAPGVSALLIPYFSRTGRELLTPQAGSAFDADQFIANAIGRYFECRGGELHFDACQADLASCPWIPQPPP
ncbi:MAG TPA: hypothetical protein VGH20_03385 [Myxococcales bacterium]